MCEYKWSICIQAPVDLKWKPKSKMVLNNIAFKNWFMLGFGTRVIPSLWVLHNNNNNNNLNLTTMKISAYLNGYLLNFLFNNVADTN